MVRRSSIQVRSAWLAPSIVVVVLIGWLAISYTDDRLGGHSGSSQPENDTYVGTQLDDPAAEFELIDHRGDRVALSDFRGKVVVLAFLDPNCTDVCPLTAMHFRQTYEALEPVEADAVAFLAINANVAVNDVADVAAASEKWGVHELPAWHFLTGDEEALREALAAYNVEARPDPEKHGEVTHTPGVLVIDPEGKQRWYVSTPLTGDLEWDGPQLSEVLLYHIHNFVDEGE